MTSDFVSTFGAGPVGAEIVGASPATALTVGNPGVVVPGVDEFDVGEL